jgi:hypothetical protein
VTSTIGCEKVIDTMGASCTGPCGWARTTSSAPGLPGRGAVASPDGAAGGKASVIFLPVFGGGSERSRVAKGGRAAGYVASAGSRESTSLVCSAVSASPRVGLVDS